MKSDLYQICREEKPMHDVEHETVSVACRAGHVTSDVLRKVHCRSWHIRVPDAGAGSVSVGSIVEEELHNGRILPLNLRQFALKIEGDGMRSVDWVSRMNAHVLMHETSGCIIFR